MAADELFMITNLSFESFTLSPLHRGTSDEDELVLVQDVIAVLKNHCDDGDGGKAHRLLIMETNESKEQSDTSDSGRGRTFTLKSRSLYSDYPLPNYLEIKATDSPKLPPHLRDLDAENLHVMLSTLSGLGEAQSFYRGVLKPLLEILGFTEGSTYTVHETDSDSFVEDFAVKHLAPRALDGQKQTVILLSGDGGIVDLVNSLARMQAWDKRSKMEDGIHQYVKPAVALLPFGTGNALASSCGLNNDSTRGLTALLRGRPTGLPMFKVRFSPGSELIRDEGRDAHPVPADEDASEDEARGSQFKATKDEGIGALYGAVVLSWALHASLVADSDTAALRRHGAARFRMAADGLLAPRDGSEPHRYRGTVTLFKRNVAAQEFPCHWAREEHMYLLATLVSNLERTLRVSPRSKPLDGVLRLVHFSPLSPDEVIKVFAAAYDGGKHVQFDNVGYEEITGLRIKFHEAHGRWRRICVDGKIVKVGGGEDNAWLELRKSKKEVVELVVDI